MGLPTTQEMQRRTDCRFGCEGAKLEPREEWCGGRFPRGDDVIRGGREKEGGAPSSDGKESWGSGIGGGRAGRDGGERERRGLASRWADQRRELTRAYAVGERLSACSGCASSFATLPHPRTAAAGTCSVLSSTL